MSAASGTAVVAPGSLATLYNSTAVSVAVQAKSIPWPTSLGGLSLEIRDSGGTALLAPLLYVAGNQINFLVPEGTALGEATLRIVSDTGSTQAGLMQVAAVAPGLFLATDYSMTPTAFLERVQPDGSRTSQPLFECSGPNSCAPVRVEAPPVGSRASLVFYGTGFRNATPENVKCSIAGYSYEFPVDLAGASGLDQIRVPLLFNPGADFWQTVSINSTAEVVVSVDGIAANRVLLFFSAPEPPCVFCK